MTRISHRGYLGLTVSDETFTDLDYADDVSLLASMLKVVVLALEILQEESSQLGLEINWSKTKLQAFDELTRSCMKALDRNIALHQLADQGPTIQYIHTADPAVWCRYLEYDERI